jgi:CheY-like chemotaxis protein
MLQPVILVAEDDQNDVSLLQWAFTRAGLKARVHYVEDGIEAIQFLALSNPKPRALLLDLKMPRASGFDVLEWLHEHPEARPTKVIVYSACYDAGDLHRASELKVDHFVVKPSTGLDLVCALKRLESCLATPAIPAMPKESVRAVGNYVRMVA